METDGRIGVTIQKLCRYSVLAWSVSAGLPVTFAQAADTDDTTEKKAAYSYYSTEDHKKVTLNMRRKPKYLPKMICPAV
ncbi:hypothetical protein [Acetobacter okinawensis]|uniref:hypothetical protein n=1 Tax=Acetobacter okinawensis TaxID=1076594 RepID=UPI0039EC64BA